ncbi:MAG TPA: C4-type zinc ribbon domain-containing protein [bacterium]|nr:C4-type zinc ribbon domain-containing protein [bacterium]
MKETIELLFALQQLDDEIDDLRADEEAIPEKKDQLSAQVSEIEAKLKALKQEALDLAKLRKDKELELDGTSQKKAKFQVQLFQVKSNREYEALQHEITGLDGQVSAFEDEILEILERSEKVTRAIADEEKTLKAAMERVKQEHAALDRDAEGLRKAIAERDGKRAGMVSGLDQGLLARYERIREVKDGLAVAAVKNGACGGCFRRIPPQEMQILRRADRLITCEGCGRMILWRGEEQ